MLLTYYGFLFAGLVLLLVLSRGSLLSEPRSVQISYLLVAPLILLATTLNSGFMLTLLLTVVVIVVSMSVLKRHAGAPVTRDTLYYSIGLWLIEAAVPAVIHLGLRSRPETEKWSLMIAAVGMLSATILLLAVWAPDVHKKA